MARSLQLLLALAACCSAAASSASSLRRAPLSTWRFRSLNGSVSIANATTPGTSHTHLLAGGVITEDPYRRFNEIDMQWIAQTTWVYETPLPKAVTGDARVVFETLDGVAHVTLNGESLGAPAVNAFRPHAFALPAKLMRNETGDNILQVVFMSPLDYMQQAAAAYPYEVPATRNFNVWAEPSHRPFLRKAGSDFGWDWGPAYATSGIAGQVFVEWISSAEETTDGSVVARLDDINVVYEFPAFNDFSAVTGHVTLDVQCVPSLRHVTLRLTLDGERHGDDIKVDLADTVATASLTVATEASLPFTIQNPTLWWPSGHGDPHLYEVRVDAFGDDGVTPLATLSHRIGFRSIELVQQPTQAGGVPGETFFFRINSVPIFMKGANWIPNDSFPTRVTSDKVAFLLQSAVASNMNMVRVWGGGRYESDFFYETCDRLGLLVWHEFMFACAMYPRDRGFLSEVRAEVEFQTRRLRKFTSLAIWGGNNENENMMEAFAAGDFMPSDKPPFNRDVAVTDFTAIFVDTLRPIVLKLDPTSRPFVDTSPSNGLLSQDPYVKRWGRSTNAIAFGDVHYYNYSGDCQDPRMYPHARFVSEFGFQSMPSLVGLQDVSAPEDWSSFQAFWRLLKFRERHENGTVQMATQIARRFHVPFPFLDESWLATPLDGDFQLNVTTRVGAYLYLTQIQQGLCYQTAIEAWRRSRNPVRGGGTMGILYWQLNDVWQGTSWSSIEFDGRWKSLQYAVQRAYAPVLLSVVQTTDHELMVVGVNDLKDKDLSIQLVYEVVATDTGEVVHSFQAAARAALPRLSSELLDNVTVSSLLTAPCDATHCFLRLRCDAGDLAIACSDVFFFFAPFKHLALGHGRVTVTSVTASSVADGGNHTAFDVALQTDGFVALFVEVEAPRVRGLWDRNSFHLVGNATQTLRFVTSENLTRVAFKQLLEVRWLQQTYETEAAVSVA